MKKKISIKPLYFYEEDTDLINAIESSCINFQKLVKSLLRKWLEGQK